LRPDGSGGWKHKNNDVPGRNGLPDSWYGSLFTDEPGFETRGHLPDSERNAFTRSVCFTEKNRNVKSVTARAQSARRRES